MSDQGKQYASFIDAELKAENDRRASVNTRAAAAVTGSAGLVTVVLAVFAVLTSSQKLVLTGCARAWLIVALGALLGAAILAVLAGVPWRYAAVSPTALFSFVGDRWMDTEVTARGQTAWCNVNVIESLRGGTQFKTKLLLAANVFQVVAISALAACTIAVI